jgi:hypothetical protein
MSQKKVIEPGSDTIWLFYGLMYRRFVVDVLVPTFGIDLANAPSLVG